MKTTKTSLQTSAQEECGVWLDTVQLKGKAKQKRVNRPISKLLNPFAQGAGYSMAVALNFTQTKMEMPKTKQSSISAFFTSERRVLNKMSASEEPNMDPAQSTLTTSDPVASGTKRRREKYFEMSNSEPGVDLERKSENVTEPEATVWQEQGEVKHSSSKNMDSESEEEQPEEFNSPQRKRRLTDASLLSGDSQPVPLAWSQDPLLTYSQYCDSEFDLIDQKNTGAKNVSNSQSSFLNSVQKNEEDFEFWIELKGTTSTQKSLRHMNSTQLNDEKENNSPLYPYSPSKNSPFSQVKPLSNHKQTQPKAASPQKRITDQQWKKADKEESSLSQFEWIKPRCSPLKKRAMPVQSKVDEDSLSTLFTQDSEGFRVIAHRGLQVRSPLKDQSNFNTGVVRTSVRKSLVEQDEIDEMLFTQDSQGNMVIKH